MDLNISLIKKIENILEMSGRFDKVCTSILAGNVDLNESSINNIRELTSLYMIIRAEHGGIIILNDKMKKDVSVQDSTLSDKLINQLYDLSTFTSINDNINNLVSNIDFEFKKIALMYPKLINKETNHLIFFINKIDKENRYIKMIEDIKKIRPENEYHVIECEGGGKKIDCSKMVGMKLSIGVEKLPSLYMVNGTNIVEIPLDKLKVCGDLVKMLD
jgi:hypothetical protein